MPRRPASGAAMASRTTMTQAWWDAAVSAAKAMTSTGRPPVKEGLLVATPLVRGLYTCLGWWVSASVVVALRVTG